MVAFWCGVAGYSKASDGKNDTEILLVMSHLRLNYARHAKEHLKTLRLDYVTE
jgi:hypothetical protein